MLPALHSKVRNLLPHPRLLAQTKQLEATTLTSLVDHKKATLLSTCIPVSLLGGTAILYKAVLDHPSSTSLTPSSLFYLVLLATQYAVQPALSKRFISTNTVKSSLTFTEEIIKAALAIVGLVFSSSTLSVLEGWNWLESLRVAGVPAALYAFQGILQYTAYLHLDPVTYNGLSQTKVFASALACAVLLGQIPSQRQYLALSLLVVSTLIFQGTWSIKSDGDKSCSEQNTKASSTWWFKGVLPCLGSTLLSGMAGALSQKGLQQHGRAGGHGRNAYLYTLEVSAYSAIFAFLLSLIRHVVTFTNKASVASEELSDVDEQDQCSLANDSFFRDWTFWTLLPVACKAFGGVLTALVHKHAGSVSKGFALTLGLILSTGMSDHELELHQVVGTILVMGSSWLHFTVGKQ